jgi:hypothetical protein
MILERPNITAMQSIFGDLRDISCDDRRNVSDPVEFICGIGVHSVTYRPVARQRPQNE